MKKIMVGMFSLAAMVGMAAVSARTVRAEGTALEGAKQESGVEFGEMGGLKARGGSSAVSASGDGVSRSALTVGKLDTKVKGRPQVPSPASSTTKHVTKVGFARMLIGVFAVPLMFVNSLPLVLLGATVIASFAVAGLVAALGHGKSLPSFFRNTALAKGLEKPRKD